MNPEVLLVVVAVVGLLTLIYVFNTFNRLVQLRQLVANAWSNIDTELKRRHDLVPNLVETVKGYAAHERDVLDRVTSARTRALRGVSPTAEHADNENELARAMRGLFAVVEGYPELKASRAFLSLQRELAETENRIQAARRFYNGNVKDLNTLSEQFPSRIIARLGGFVPAAFFEVDSAVDREAPRVQLG